uniref:Uncharacterized protein n=1 Tax=viral metagenome TaxID=1070528 RepID=A0A6M3LKL7_9ZZZZ
MEENFQMDINELILSEAPGDNEHDAAYRKVLLEKHEFYKGMPRADLQIWQGIERGKYDGGRISFAGCLVIYELICEFGKSGK